MNNLLKDLLDNYLIGTKTSRKLIASYLSQTEQTNVVWFCKKLACQQNGIYFLEELELLMKNNE